MKKTLVALAVTAFATSASALTVYENEGTKADIYGSLRLLLDNSGSKTTKFNNSVATSTVKKGNHTNLKNDGSRFGVRVDHNLANDLFAFGRLEFRFNGNATTTDQFGDLFAHRAYVGFGSKEYGEIAFGRQVTIGDDISQAGFANGYGVAGSPLTADGKAVIRYDYKGVKGLHVGADYRFAEKRNDGEVVEGTLKSGYGVGAVYSLDLAEGQSAKVAAGYTRDNFATGKNFRHYVDAALVGAQYTISDLTLALDYGIKNEKNGSERTITHFLNTGAKYQVTPAIAIYGDYAYQNGKTKDAGVSGDKVRTHGFTLGTEYKIHKNVFTFVEGKIQQTKKYNEEGKKLESARNNAFGVGLRVHW